MSVFLDVLFSVSAMYMVIYNGFEDSDDPHHVEPAAGGRTYRSAVLEGLGIVRALLEVDIYVNLKKKKVGP